MDAIAAAAATSTAAATKHAASAAHAGWNATVHAAASTAHGPNDGDTCSTAGFAGHAASAAASRQLSAAGLWWYGAQHSALPAGQQCILAQLSTCHAAHGCTANRHAWPVHGQPAVWLSPNAAWVSAGIWRARCTSSSSLHACCALPSNTGHCRPTNPKRGACASAKEDQQFWQACIKPCSCT
jgi:hypothetical protein